MKNTDLVLNTLRNIISLIGVAVIVVGALKSALLCVTTFIKNKANISSHLDVIRYELGLSIILGLEFMVGADIIESVIEPTYYSIGLLGLLVIIRTVLSYFLNKELESLSIDQIKELN